jgi:hypothetical protein
MARRPSLSEAGVTRPGLTLAPGRAPARQGKKAVAFWVDPATSTQLRVTAATLGRSVQEIMVEALDDWFAKRGQRAA